MQGDQVLVEVEPPKADGRRMGRIVRMMERRNTTVVGVFHYARSSDRAQGEAVGLRRTSPFDERMTQHDSDSASAGAARTMRRVRHAAPRAGQ
jgi:ribonuclease R